MNHLFILVVFTLDIIVPNSFMDMLIKSWSIDFVKNLQLTWLDFCPLTWDFKFYIHWMEIMNLINVFTISAKKLKLQQIGSFKVLNGKVDLSTHEAVLTLQDWEHKLRNLREETNVRTIAKEISAAQTVRTVKILAYKNGEGRLRTGELICGSTIEGVSSVFCFSIEFQILDQCTYRLGLNSAARRIFIFGIYFRF